jgi:hypothetical protein
MKKDEVPQDLGALGKITKELCYATDSTGKYVAEQSIGWEVKKSALDVAWGAIEKRVAAAREKVLKNEASPVLFFMEYRLMDMPILAGYTGFWQWQVKRHMQPESFKQLSTSKLQKYADAFNVSIGDLKSMTVHED